LIEVREEAWGENEAGVTGWTLPLPLRRAAGVAAWVVACAGILLFVGPRLLARFGLGPVGMSLSSTDDLHAILVALSFQWSLVGRETKAGQVAFGIAAGWVLILLLAAAAVCAARAAG
jgi:hypothetical protein